MRINLLTLIALLTIVPFLISSCENSDIEPLDPTDLPIVVEGWIEEGEAPVVMVTHSVDLTGDSPDFDDFVEKWCRVSIYDNDRQYLLTGRINNAYLPQLIFTHGRLRGQQGHTYRLVVEAYDRTLTATGTIQPAPALDSLRAEPLAGADSLYAIRAYVSPGECPYMKFFTKTLGTESRLYPAFLSTVSAEDYKPGQGVSLTRGKRTELNDSTAAEFSHYFHSGDVVLVHACSVEADVFRFWQVYDAHVSLSENLFFSFGGNLPGNIDGGAGYFAAYGRAEGVIAIP